MDFDDWMARVSGLQAFAEEHGLDNKTVRLLVRLTGRGYQHPTTKEGWERLWDSISKAVNDDDSTKREG